MTRHKGCKIKIKQIFTKSIDKINWDAPTIINAMNGKPSDTAKSAELFQGREKLPCKNFPQ